MIKYLIAFIPLAITAVIWVVYLFAIVLLPEGHRALQSLGGLAFAWLLGGPALTFILASAMGIHDLFKAAEKRMERRSMGRGGRK